MMRSNLYIKREGGKAFYYLVGERVCDHCGQSLQERAVVFFDWKGDDFSMTVLCHNCLSHKPPQMPHHVLQYFQAMVRDQPPLGVTPFFLKRPEMGRGQINLWEAARPDAKTISDSSATRVIDRTSISEGVSLLPVDEKKLIEEKGNL